MPRVSLACVTSRQAVQGWLSVGDLLADPDRLPVAAGAARAGLLDPAKWREIQRVTAPLSVEQAGQVDALVTHRTLIPDPTVPVDPDAGDGVVDVALRVVPDLRDALHAAVLQVDPAGARERARSARRARSIVRERYDEVMTRLVITLPAVTATQILACLDAHVARLHAAGDPRTLSQLRVDVLTALVLGDLDPDSD